MQCSQVSKTNLKTNEVSVVKTTGSSPRSPPQTSVQNDVNEAGESVPLPSHENSRAQGNEPGEEVGPVQIETSTSQKSTDMLDGPLRSVRRPAILGRTPVSAVKYLWLTVSTECDCFDLAISLPIHVCCLILHYLNQSNLRHPCMDFLNIL